MKKRQIIIIGATLFIFVASFSISNFLAGQKEPPKSEVRPPAKKFVKTQQVKYSDIQTEVIAYGRVQTAQSLDLLSEVSGRMYEGNVRLKEGINFKKGTLLFYVDDEEASLNLKSQKSNFLRDLAAILPDLKLDFRDNYSTWENYFSRIDIDNDLPEMPEAKSEKEKTFLATKGIFSSYYSIKSAEARLKKYKYYAPWNGSISEVSFETGAYISPGARIGKIIRTGIYELKVAVETRDIPWIQEAAPASIYSAETQQLWSGEVSRISDYVNQNTQSVDVYVSIFPNGQKIYDGQFFQAAIPARVVKDGMIMPRNAIYNGNEVFVLEDSLLRTRTINIFRLTDEAAVFNGIENGKELVVEPLLNAHNNMKAFKYEEKDIDLELKDDKETQIANKEDSDVKGS